MTTPSHEQMLKKIIEKARAHGYKGMSQTIIVTQARMFGITSANNFYVRGLLFSHDFAKAFFGEGESSMTYDDGETIWRLYRLKDDLSPTHMKAPLWKVFLSEAVLSEDPILYYYSYL